MRRLVLLGFGLGKYQTPSRVVFVPMWDALARLAS
jgi:hypothetical protein